MEYISRSSGTAVVRYPPLAAGPEDFTVSLHVLVGLVKTAQKPGGTSRSLVKLGLQLSSLKGRAVERGSV